MLWLEAPMIEGEARYVHFSWKDESFCIRDYVGQRERRQSPGLTPSDVWKTALDRIPCKGEMYVPVENFEFWTGKLTELTEKRRQGANPSVWSRLSTKFAPRPKEADPQPKNNHNEEGLGVYEKSITLWKGRDGFDVVDGTVGCSARYYGEPILWMYPTRFQVAPQGKGNAHFDQVMDLRVNHFPGSRREGSIGFSSDNFHWDKFQGFVTAVQDMIQKANA